MPYIVQDWRDRIDPHIKALTEEFDKLPREEVSKEFRWMIDTVLSFSFRPQSERKPWLTVSAVSEKSECLGKFINKMPEAKDNIGGILNYTFTMLAIHFAGSPRYSKVNRLIGICAKTENDWSGCLAGYSNEEQFDIIGALRCMQLEFYHKLVRPYEDKKTKENGDVF